jgi:hypothetical protein
MRSSPSHWPFEGGEHLDDALREQEATPAEIAEWAPVMGRLAAWPDRHITPTDSQRLLAALAPVVPAATPAASPVRQALRQRFDHPQSRIAWLLDMACTQVSLFGQAFWLVSALVTLVGAMAVLGNSNASLSTQELMLRASGPFLAFLGTVIAFRGTQERVLECELVCPPAPLQLAMARLVIVLGYDLGLGLALCLALWAGGSAQVLALVLSWFTPLLLVAGLALLLSLRLSIQVAAALAYGSWLAVLAFTTNWGLQVLSLTPLSDAAIGCLGLAMLAVALLCLQADLPHLLPRV